MILEEFASRRFSLQDVTIYYEVDAIDVIISNVSTNGSPCFLPISSSWALMMLPPNEDSQMQASLVIFTVITRGNQQSVGGNMQPGPNAGSKAASITKILSVLRQFHFAQLSTSLVLSLELPTSLKLL